MRISRRALFFLAVALVFVLMIPPTPREFRWLNLAMAGLALFWAALLAIEDLSNRRRNIDLPRGDRRSDLPSGD
jgi:ABC-type transport system involved in cytochrome c biogenesis permease component